MRMGIFRMPFGCPSRGENGAFESIVYYESASFHSKHLINSLWADTYTVRIRPNYYHT